MRSLPRSRPVRIATRMPAFSASGAMVARCWRARISVGAISAACRPASTTVAAASSATTVLPEPTSPCSSRSMRCGRARSVTMSSTARALRRRQRIGQRRDHLGAQDAFAGAAAAGQLALVGAHQRERELAGEQFVIGEPRPGLALRQDVGGLGRVMQALQRVGEGGKALAFEPGRRPAIPAASGFSSSAASAALRTGLRRQPFGQRIDRLDQRQLVELGLAHHAVGMHHLQHAVVERGGARDVAQLADRQELFQIVALGVEIGERERAGVVARFRCDRAARGRFGGGGRWRSTVTATVATEPGTTSRSFGRDAAVDGAGRQMEQQIDDARRRILAAEQPAVELLQLRPDAGKRGQRGKQRIEQRRAHGDTLHGFLTRFNTAA